MRRGGATIAVTLAALMLSGCMPSLASLDAQTEALVRDIQRLHLGSDTDMDPRVTPQRPASPHAWRNDSDPYHRYPDTRNPAADELATERGGGEVSLDDPPDLSQTMGREPVQPIMLTLEDALGYAVANSREYRNRREQLYLAALDMLAEKHLWGPRFFETFTARVDGTPDGGDRDHALELINELRVTQRLPYGGSISATALVNYVNQLSTAPGSSARSGQDAELSLSIEQPLLKGFGIVAQEDLIQAQRDLIYAARAFERFRRQFLFDVATQYYNLILQENVIATQVQQVDNLRWLARRMEALANAGREPFFEVQRAQQQLLFAGNTLLNLQERFAGQLDSFKLFIGMPIDQTLSIDKMTLSVPEPALDPVEAVKTAQRFRLDLQTTANQVEDAFRRTRNAKNATLPELNAFAGVSIPTDSSRQYGGLNFKTGDGSYSAGVTFTTELPRVTEQIAHRESIINLERARRSYALQRDEIAQEVRRLLRSIESARFSLALQERNIQLARRRFKEVTLRLRSLGPRDYIEAQEGLARAINQRDTAQRDLQVNILEFLLQSGQMRIAPDGRWRAPGTLGAAPPDPRVPDARRLIQPENDLPEAKTIDEQAVGDDGEGQANDELRQGEPQNEEQGDHQ